LNKKKKKNNNNNNNNNQANTEPLELYELAGKKYMGSISMDFAGGILLGVPQ
jgi:hypothetical protein